MWNKGPRFTFQRIALSLFAVLCLVPAVLLVLNSFTLFGRVCLAQYEDILLFRKEFYLWFWNSVGYTAAILVIHLPVSVLAAYGFTQYQFRGKKLLMGLYILFMLLPFQATVVSQYITLDAMSLLDTPLAIILPNAYNTFGAFLLTQFMRGIPPEVIQAARVEGANGRQIFFRIVLPLCRPAIVSLTVLQLFTCWSLIDQVLLFLRGSQLHNLALELTSTQFGTSASAAGVIYAVLPLLVYLYCKGSLQQGISLVDAPAGGAK